MHLPPRRLAAVFAAALVLSACSDDDDPIASSSEPAVTASASPTPSVADFCEANVRSEDQVTTIANEGEAAAAEAAPTSSASAGESDEDETSSPSSASESPEPDGEEEEGEEQPLDPAVLARGKAAMDPILADITRNSPASLTGAVDDLVSGIRKFLDEGTFAAFESDSFRAAGTQINDFMLANCGYTKVVATATDYEYNGLPITTPAGPTSLTLKNEGEEFHIFVVFRINDDVTTSAEDLLKLGEEEATSKIVFVTEAGAAAGTSDTTFSDLKPGRYGVACFISKDTNGDGSVEGDGPPHFMEGMVEEFTVTESGAPQTSSSPAATSGSSSSSSSSEADETATARPTSS